MTKITDDNGTRYVDVSVRRRRRAPSRALKFGQIQVGDQIMMSGIIDWKDRRQVMYYMVTDRWFDPVKGQSDPVAGEMVGYSYIQADGTVHSHKSCTTVRGLASQQFDYADVDYIGLSKARMEAEGQGVVIGIGRKRKR